MVNLPALEPQIQPMYGVPVNPPPVKYGPPPVPLPTDVPLPTPGVFTPTPRPVIPGIPPISPGIAIFLVLGLVAIAGCALIVARLFFWKQLRSLFEGLLK